VVYVHKAKSLSPSLDHLSYQVFVFFSGETILRHTSLENQHQKLCMYVCVRWDGEDCVYIVYIQCVSVRCPPITNWIIWVCDLEKQSQKVL